MLLRLLAVLFISLAARENLSASLLVYEGFDYGPSGSALLSNNGGSGFSNAWSTAPGPANTDPYVLNNSTLTDGLLQTSGQSASSIAISGIGGLARTFNQTFGADVTTIYMSVLMRPEGVLNAGFSFGYFGMFLQSNANHLFLGKPGGGDVNHWGMEVQGGGGQVSTGVGAVVGQTVLLVVRADFLPGADKFTLYLDPTPGGPEPLTGTVKNDADAGTITGLEIFSGGAFSIDEIRIGNTFADVTPVPEPTTAALMLASVALLSALKKVCR